MKQILKILFIVSIILSVVIMLGCTGVMDVNLENKGETDKIVVVTTLFPYYEFAKEVGGDRVEVTLLLPPGSEVHSFEPKPSDIRRIENADIFIYNGAGLEPWADDILKGINNDNLKTIEASYYVNLLDSKDDHEEPENPDEETVHNDGEYDPHIWLDFENDKVIVDVLSIGFSKQDPDNKEFYMTNAEAYKKKLDDLDTKYADKLSACKQDKVISGGHNSLRYLGNKYNFELLSVYGISPNSEPTPRKITEITNILKEHGINYILFEDLLDPKIADVIAKETGAETLIINPGHNIKKEEFDNGMTFISIMENNLDSLEKAMECN